MKDGAALLVALVVLLLSALWYGGHRQLERAICPQPVKAGGQTLSCDGSATIRLPDGSTAVITTTSPPPQAASTRR